MSTAKKQLGILIASLALVAACADETSAPVADDAPAAAEPADSAEPAAPEAEVDFKKEAKAQITADTVDAELAALEKEIASDDE